MRKRQTFLLTILTAENGEASFCGRLKVISSGKTFTFTSLDELYRLIASEMDENALQQLLRRDLAQSTPTNHVPATR
jgi:hypothetical protein